MLRWELEAGTEAEASGGTSHTGPLSWSFRYISLYNPVPYTSLHRIPALGGTIHNGWSPPRPTISQESFLWLTHRPVGWSIFSVRVPSSPMTLACVKAVTENSQTLVPCLSMASYSSFLCYIAILSISINTYFFLIISVDQKARHNLAGFSTWKSPRLVSGVTQSFRPRRDSFGRQGKQLDQGVGHLNANVQMAWLALRKWES